MGLNGTETEQHLKQWTEGVPKGSKLHEQMLNHLIEFLDKADVAINSSAHFSIVSGDGDFESTEASSPGDLEVEALTTLARRLTPTHRRKLIRQLEFIQEA